VVKATELAITGAWVFEPTVFPDNRGMFATPFQNAAFREALGFDL
jgi:dTDP-4-dehydrorhamnose 3,5-epimerase-like enzyme